MKYFLLFLFMVVLIYPNEVNAKILHVGAGFKYADLNGALQTVAMGDTILVHQGIYAGGIYFENLKGSAERPISIIASGEVVFQGGSPATTIC